MSTDPAAPSLVVGPVLRYVDETRATIWAETSQAGAVHLQLGTPSPTAEFISDVPAWGGADRTVSTDTFSVHGHHYALVRVEGLEPGTVYPYRITIDDADVWPLFDSEFPPSMIRTTDLNEPHMLSFGSCRRSDPLDDEHIAELGVDALVRTAASLVDRPLAEWPDTLMMLGDQVYADEPSDEIAARILAEEPKTSAESRAAGPDDHEVSAEIKNFEQYTWLYAEAWTPPPVRWLLSTVPTCMLLDDHDLRDDWNTSQDWRDEVTAKSWWRDRVVGAYGSYWVYQHLGNLSPAELDADDLWNQLSACSDDDERTRLLDEFAWNTDQDSSTARFSFYRDLGGAGRHIRLVAIDSRCARILDPDQRRMVDETEWRWITEKVLAPDNPYDHLVLCSTLPFLMPPGIHHLETWNEAVAQNGSTALARWFGEKVRQEVDLEHWPAFGTSFDEFVDLLDELTSGDAPPDTVLMLGGDVHCSYTARASLPSTTGDERSTAIHQLTMSPFRNDIERVAKWANHLLNRPRGAAFTHWMARRAGAPDSRLDWQLENGPWFDNGVMSITWDGPRAQLRVEHASLGDDGDEVLTTTADVSLNRPGSPDPDADDRAMASD